MVSAAQQRLIDSSLTPSRVAGQVSTSVTAKTLDIARLQGAQMVAMIDKAGVQSQSGVQAGDPLVAKATGLGANLDVYA